MKDSDRLKQALEDLKELHHSLQSLLFEVSDNLNSNKYMNDLPEWSDVGFLCREISMLLDESRKESKARWELASSSLAKYVMVQSMTDPAIETRCKGTLCSVRFTQTMEASIPKAGTKEFEELMAWLGVSRTDGVVKPDYTKMSEVLTQRAQDGQKLPPGVGHPIMRNTAIYTRRKT